MKSKIQTFYQLIKGNTSKINMTKMNKKIGILLFVLLASCFNAQTSCENAAPFCASGVSGVTFPATTSTPQVSAQTGPNYGCLGTQPNAAWYYLQISTSGNLNILIQGQIVSPPGPGQDVDFICWGPFNTLAGICNSLTAANTIDCSYSASYTETLHIPTGITGQYYMVLITNFANVQQNIQFSQYAGTGSTNCALVSNNSSICAGNSATIVASNSSSLTSTIYSLSPGNLSNTTGTFIVTPTLTTNYTVHVLGINNVSVAVTQTAVSTVSVYSQPSSVPTATNTTCTSTLNAFNLGVTFYPIAPVPNYTVTWASIPGGVNSPTTTALSGAIPPGSYNATITAAGGCSATAAFTLNPVPEPAIISLAPLGNSHTITCYQPVITVTALVSSLNYTWSSNVAVFNGPVVAFTSTDVANWTIVAQNPISGCVSTQTVAIYQNTVTPSGTVTPLSQNITCNITSITTITATANPSVNITHQFMSPQGGTFSAQSYTVPYLPGGTGTFTHCVVNDANGCSTCNTFSVFSSQGFPTFNVTSPQSFTLGCNSTSCATIKIENGNTTPSGGAVTYTLLPPGGSTVTPTGSLSANAIYTTCTPGTWTVITKDNSTFCETRVAISVLSNTFAPDISAIVPRQILDCNVPKITLQGQSLTNNVSYVWGFPASPGTLVGDTITVISVSATPNNSFIANYTLTITDNNSTCKSFSIIPMYQNLYPPKALVSNGGTSSLSCYTGSITLTNQSSTSIPPTSGFTYQLPVIGYIWDGPSPQEPGQVNTTYIAATVGIYTLTAKDLNNGCISKATTTITDNRIYPELNKPVSPPPFVLDCGSNAVKIYPYFSNVLPGFTYTWITSGVVVSGDNTATLTTSEVGRYKMITTNTVNGCSSSAEVTVINGTLNATFEAQPIKGFAPLPVTFYNNSASSLGSSSITAYWNFGNATTSVTTESNLSPVTTYSLPGTYKVTMFANKGTCIDTLSLNIEVEIPSVMEIPNVFTPNGDNVNDLFFLKASNLETITIHIYDRWGHIVYISESEHGNIEWDGKYQSGKQAADGTYFYLIKAMGKDGKAYDKKGTVSLYR